MSRNGDGSIQDKGHLLVLAALFFGVLIWINAHGVFNEELLWLVLMGVAIIGMRVGGRAIRRELAERREEDWKEQAEKDSEQEQLKACQRRRERRDAIRAGRIENDGLSDLGREREGKPIFSKLMKDLEAHGVSFPPTEEDIFALEERDKRIEAAWKRKVSADGEWKKIQSN